jgi:predicted secreted protein
MVQTSDGGYALAGFTYSFGAGDADYWLVKTDSAGNEQWNRTYGGANYDEARFFIQTSDDGYTLSGRTYSFGAGASDVWLVKVNASGILSGETGLVWTDSSSDTITVYRGASDPYWNFVRVQIFMDPLGRGLGDLNGDSKVNLQDLVILANAYGSRPGDAIWKINADIDGNGEVGLPDLVMLALHYGQNYS